ncbi:MAG: DNA translocase FtsK [Candidatus Eisenbacteria bacterium]|nr:DNA translocase FtsK [Candidatus Eisenbacteria bacterium]
MALFDHMTDDQRRQLLGVLLLFLGLLVGVSLGTHVYFAVSDGLGPEIWATELGVANRHLSNWLFDLLGVCAWLIPLLFILWGWNRIVDGDAESLALRSVFLTAVSLIVVSLIHLFGGDAVAGITGVVGAWIADLGTRHIGRIGTLLAGAGAAVVITLLTTELDLGEVGERLADFGRWVMGAGSSVAGAFERVGERRAERRAEREKSRRGKTASRTKKEPKSSDARAEGKPAPGRPDPEPEPRPPRKKPKAPTIVSQSSSQRRASARPKAPAGGYRLPSLSLLDDPPPEADREVSKDELLARSKLLEEKLADFGVEAAVVQVHPGPVITRFEIEPARGVKVSQIANLQDDLALAMRATAIRIIAPIPGRGAVGIEIPNEHPAVVYLKDTLSSEAYEKTRTEIPLALGKDTTGRVACADLAKMPHLLVAGATGSGKSICLNALLTGLVFRSTPEQVRFLMIDPKRLELPRYEGIPHLLAPVITEAKEAAMALQWLVTEMDRRYDILSELTVRDIYGFNRRIEEGAELDGLAPEDRHRLPHIVVFVDEFADLMVRAPREVEAPVQRLAQMARAVGIHLVFATQRPSVDVITGVIKANFASRIAFRVISMTDSRTVLDRNGAETLLGNGDMLFLPTGKPEPVRLHGAYIAPEETARVVAFLRKQGPPRYLFDLGDSKGMARIAATQQDELYDDAVEIVVGTQMGSTSMLQRKLSVGYARAGRLMDLLEANGVVGPFKGSKARDVLVGPEYLEQVAVATAAAPGDDGDAWNDGPDEDADGVDGEDFEEEEEGYDPLLEDDELDDEDEEDDEEEDDDEFGETDIEIDGEEENDEDEEEEDDEEY